MTPIEIAAEAHAIADVLDKHKRDAAAPINILASLNRGAELLRQLAGAEPICPICSLPDRKHSSCVGPESVCWVPVDRIGELRALIVPTQLRAFNDAEPPADVQFVRDAEGDIWKRDGDFWIYASFSYSWLRLSGKFAPLTEVR